MDFAVCRRFWNEEDGQDLIEYALLASFISLASAVAVTHLGTVVGNVFDAIATELEDGSTS
jgi:Flp pilus assembly pilin Flp